MTTDSGQMAVNLEQNLLSQWGEGEGEGRGGEGKGESEGVNKIILIHDSTSVFLSQPRIKHYELLGHT